VSERRTDDAKLIEAVRILSRTIQTDDGVIGACLAEAATRLETLVEERRWIPVGERLPERMQTVWVWSDLGFHTASLDSFGQWLDDDENPGKKITHWQPLPPCPEGAKPDLPTG
jgi:hypothetical protein